MILVITWLIASYAVGYYGEKKQIGFWGGFLWAALLSPLIGAIVVATSKEVSNAYKCRHCGYASNANSYYCPRCLKDTDGFTAEENKERFKNGVPASAVIAAPITVRQRNMMLGWYVLVGLIALAAIIAVVRAYN